MMNLLSEQPLLVSLMLAALGAGLIFTWLQSGKQSAAIAGVVCLLLMPAAWVLAANLTTDRERITEIIYATAEAVAANDHTAAVAVIGNEKTRQMALAELPNYVFQMAEVNQLTRVDVDTKSIPMTAQVELTVKADVSGKRGGFNNLRVLRKLELEFEKRGDDWLVVAYHHSPVIGSGP
jgi:hypothetical protein